MNITTLFLLGRRLPGWRAVVVLALVAVLAPPPARAASITVTNASFEANTGAPADWVQFGSGVQALNWSSQSAGEPAADGTNAVLCSQASFNAIEQTTTHVVAPNELITLTAAFGHRDNSTGVSWGGYWLRLAVVKSDGSVAYVVANHYSTDGDPGNGHWGDQTLTWRSPTNLANLPIIVMGIKGTVPDGTADISSGTWHLEVLVGNDYPGGTGSPYVQAGVDNVRLNVVPAPASPGENASVSGHLGEPSGDVAWTSLGTNENDSMPLGNGDLAANVWTEQNGDLVLLVSKADAWTELGQLVKLGRIRIALTPNPFAGAAHFTQILSLADASIEIKSGANQVRVWVDAHHPVLHVEAKLAHPATLRAGLELWRRIPPDIGDIYELGGRLPPIQTATDTVFAASARQITWCHFNPSSIYPMVMEVEHLQSLLGKYPDPFLHRCFGAAMTGPGLVAGDNHTLSSAAPEKNLRLDLVALTEAPASSPEAWRTKLDSLVSAAEAADLPAEWRAHQQWWHDFWQRSWIRVGGTADALKVSQGYRIQRYMMAASSRGAFPVKFNGGLFTVGHDLPPGRQSTVQDHNPDYRKWGNCYWNQNNRLLYWPLLATGDFDLVKPWFDMYLKALPLARDRTQIYYHHPGAVFCETMYFWGPPNLPDFCYGLPKLQNLVGWYNPTTEIRSGAIRYYTQGGLEVCAQMLDEFALTQDADFARQDLVPLADAVVTYYGRHWPRDQQGKIRMAPAQSLETYQFDAVNPTPDIAGLQNVISGLLALPARLTSARQRGAWKEILDALPPIATGTTYKGKIPQFGQKGDPDGTPVILQAEKIHIGPCNVENPELYAVFPYRLYGVGKPGLKLARDTFAARLFPQDTCWGQDGMEAAVLGLTAGAQTAVVAEFTHYGDQRFRWFWSPANDWIPDLDNGGAGMMTLQLMLMQCDGKRIQLLPAWPKNWTADFKLHAPDRTTVEGRVENGRLTHLQVTPKSRARDVVVVAEGRSG